MELPSNYRRAVKAAIKEDLEEIKEGNPQNADVIKGALERITTKMQQCLKRIDENGINQRDKDELELYVKKVDEVWNTVKDFGEGKLNLP